MKSQLRAALVVFVLLTFLTGVGYPLMVTLVAQVFWPFRSGGSILLRNGRPIGSELVGQHFSAPQYFWGRPSATAPVPYNAASSTGSNLGPTNPAQQELVRERVAALHQANPTQTGPVPVELATASASGLDPEISPAAAEYQVPRVANARGWSSERVRRLVASHTAGRTFGLLGEPRVNVLRLNLALDEAGQGDAALFPTRDP